MGIVNVGRRVDAKRTMKVKYLSFSFQLWGLEQSSSIENTEVGHKISQMTVSQGAKSCLSHLSIHSSF